MMIESERLRESGDKEALSEFNIFSNKITEALSIKVCKFLRN